MASILDLIPLEVPSHRRTGAKARLFHRLASSADMILTLSEFSADRIQARLGVSDEKIVVAPIPPRPVFRGDGRGADADPTLLTRLASRRPFFVAVADMHRPDPRKRLEWLEAIGKGLREDGYDLIVVGTGTERWANESSHMNGVGRVTDEVLASLYRRAVAFVYTSAYEGQGLPPLEALACGTPVVAMANTSIPEVVGTAGILVEEYLPPAEAALGPHRSDDPACQRLVEACRTLANDCPLRSSLAQRAVSQARAFSESRFAAGLEVAYAGGKMANPHHPVR